MLSFQLNPIAPSTPIKMNGSIVHKTLKGRVTKNTKKTVTSPKKQVSSPDEMMRSSASTPATSPNRLAHHPLSKQQGALLRGMKTSLMKSRNPIEPKEGQMDLDKKIKHPIKTNTSSGIKTKKPKKSEKPVFNSKFAKETTFGGVVKNKKEAKSVLIPNFSKCSRAPPAISTERLLLRPNGKGFVALGREVAKFGVGNVLRSLESDAMDTTEDYDWSYDGFDGYLVEEHRAKCVQFPEMDLEPEALLLYYKGEVNEYGIA